MSITMALGILIGLLREADLFPFSVPAGVLPCLIFLMLFFTFLRIRPRSLRLYAWHAVLVGLQVGASMLIYYALRDWDVSLAQGVMLCVLMPAATAAPIIAGKLGGSVQDLTPFTLLSSVSSAFIIPLVFPVINPEAHIPFVDCFLRVLHRVGPVLLLPAITAWVVRYVYQLVRHKMVRSERNQLRSRLMTVVSEIPFWLWMSTLTVLMDGITRDVIHYDGSWMIMLYMALGALLTCLLQFFGGKWIGRRLTPEGVNPLVNRVTAGQALGQKNTTLGIWLAQTYLSPISSLAPAAYIVWQNLFNAWQLARAAKGKRN